MKVDKDTFFARLKEIGHDNGKRDELRALCIKEVDKVLKYLPRRILNNDSVNIIDCIFNGLSEDINKKIKVVDIVLTTLRKESMSLTHCGDMVSRLCLELPRLPVEELVRWSNASVQSIVEDNDINMVWRDILPECLNAVASHSVVKHCDTEISGVEFKVKCVDTLSQFEWKERQLVQITAMFKDMNLARSDHEKVVKKICSFIAGIPPEILPPLVLQLLKLCKLYNIEIVLSHLSQYFNFKLYSKLEPPQSDSESTTMDIDDIVQYSNADLSQCLSMCLYHISQGVADPELIRKHIKNWPKTQLLRAPFLVDLALAVSEKGAGGSVCLDAIKSSIELRVLDEIRSKESAWVRSALRPDADVANVLKVLTTESANHRELTVLSLIKLAFVLLSVARKPAALTCWSHGTLILVRLSKAQPETAGYILEQLSDRLSSDCKQKQYTDCLYILCKLTPLSVERCSHLCTILENVQPVGEHADQIYAAVRPLISFSTKTRDTLVMVCRKGLYSGDSQRRRLALSGFLTVLRNMKLSRSLSQPGDHYSVNSYLSQITLDLHSTQQTASVTSKVGNKTICLEVVSILRRCLDQEFSVKQLLYTEMYNCAKEKPGIYESILELFYEHLVKYLPDDDDGTPLLLDKCVPSHVASAVEPIGRLLYVIAQFLQPVEEESDDILASQSQSQSDGSSAFYNRKLMEVLEKLCNSDLLALINMDELQDNTLKVQQILQCYEALIAHCIMQWNRHSSNAATTYNLFKAYNQLLNNVKNFSKGGRKNKTLNETKDTIKSTQKSQKSEKPAAGTSKEKGKKPVKFSNLLKDRAAAFKPLPCLWDAPTCLRVLELLYSEEVTWSSLDERNQIRSKCDFNQFALRCVLNVVTEMVEKPAVDVKPFLSIAALLYKHTICKFQEMCNFDDQTALGCLELLKSCLSFLFSPNHSLKLDKILADITSPEKSPSERIAEMLNKVYKALTILEEENEQAKLDAVRTKIAVMLIQLTNCILEVPIIGCVEFDKALDQLEDFMKDSKMADSAWLLPALLVAWGRQQREALLLEQLLESLGSALGLIAAERSSSDEEEEVSRSWHAMLGHVCTHLNERLRCAEHLLGRARDLAVALPHATHTQRDRLQRDLSELYESIVIQLCELTKWTSKVAKLRCTIGAGSDKVLGLCTRMYTLLATLVKDVPRDLAESLRLERLIKLSGKEFSAVTDDLVFYVENSKTQSKRARNPKLLVGLVRQTALFSKNVLLLAGKTKLDFEKYLSMGTSRDYKIKRNVLKEIMDAQDQPAEDANEDEDINDAATEILSPVASDSGERSDNEELASDVEVPNSDDEVLASDEEPAKKKKKKTNS